MSAGVRLDQTRRAHARTLGADEIVMSDSESPQLDPERKGSPQADSPDAPEQAAPEPAAPEADGETESQQSTDPSGRPRRFASRRTGVWAAVAVACVAAGTVASILGAQSIAHKDASNTVKVFQLSSADISASVKQGIERQEDLLVSASTFFAGNPKASAIEFSRWAKWAHLLRRYPELERLGLVALVRAPELAQFEARVTGHELKATTPRSASAALKGLRVTPPGNRPYYCFALGAVARSAAGASPSGLDYCAVTPGLQSSRETGASISAAVAAGRAGALGLETPVYRGGARPTSTTARRAAFVGWLRQVLIPGAVLLAALRNHPEDALRMRYKAGHSSVVFTSGTQLAGAQSANVRYHNGWSVRIFGPPASTRTLANGEAVALLIGGIAVSVIVGLLLFLLGIRRPSAPAPAPAPAAAPETPEDQPEDLYDPLTGLPNRMLTLDLADRMVARARRQSGMLAGALVIDIDWFKDVNDRLGHDAGDQLLKVVADRLEAVVRAGDTVGRLGSDEFVVLVESAARGARMDSLARRIMEALHKPIELEGFGPNFFLTASIGVAFGQYASPSDLLRDAQLALQAGKAAGKDRYTLFNANMRSVIEGRGALEAELNTALLDKQFFLLYQPIVDLTTKRVVGLEALIRWQHPTKGVLPAEEFLPLAEETGLIVPIGRWALEEACTRGAAWNVAGHTVGISVHVAPNQLNRDGFATDVRRALQQSGIEPAKLTIGIAEAMVMIDVAAAAQRIEEIKRLGVRVAIDDFGSGYAYRSDLQRMPLDFLKVDRGSLAASDDEDYRSWLLEAILHFARDLSLTVIAKGVDTQEQLVTIQAMGCTMAQGMFTGEPMPAGAVESLFAAGARSASAGSPGQPF
jgi:diguanylate cyclase (GGDEF)-like protein